MSDTIYAASGDGIVGGGSNTSWATARGVSTGDVAASASAGPTYLFGYSSAGAGDAFTYYMFRAFLAFDLSGIPAGATITAATVSLYASGTEYHGGGGTTANNSACLVAGTQASTSSLATSDFNKVGSTLLANRLSYQTDLASAGYKDFTLNSSGLSLLQSAIGGYAKLAVITGYDFDATQPVNNGYSGALGYMSEQTGTSNDPKLVVTYSIAKSASDSATATDTATAPVTGSSVSASDSASATDTAAILATVRVTQAGAADVTDDWSGTGAVTSHSPSSGSWTNAFASGPQPALSGSGTVVHSGTASTSIYRHSDSGLTTCTAEGSFVVGGSTGNGAGGLMARWNGLSLAGGSGTGYQVILDGGPYTSVSGRVRLRRIDAGASVTNLADYDLGSLTVGTTRTVRMECEGSALRVYVDNALVISVTDATYSSGYLGWFLTSGTEAAGMALTNTQHWNTTASFTLVDPSDTVTATETASVGVPNTPVSASDSVTATDTAVSVTANVAKSASDSVTATDTAAAAVRIDPRRAHATSITVGWGAMRTIASVTPSTLFPGVCKKANGDLLLVTPRMTSHLAGDGEIYTMTGADNGDGTVTWRNDWTKIYARKSAAYDCRSSLPALVPSGPHAGKVVVAIADVHWVAGDINHYLDPYPATKVQCFTRILLSTDETCTAWTEIATLPPAFPSLVADQCQNDFTECPVVFLPNGDWMIATYSRETHDFIGWYSSAYFRSTDNGATWTHEGFIDRANTANTDQATAHMADEPFLLMMDNGEMLCVIRDLAEGRNPDGTDGYSHKLWRCANPTNRGGMVWTSEGSCTVSQAASRPALIQHSNGSVFHAFRVVVSGLSWQGAWRSSTDYGHTWSSERNLDNGNATSGNSGTGVYSYGQWAELSNGGLIHVYCQDAGGASTSSTREARMSVTATASTPGQAMESAAATDSASVIVGVGAIAKSASDSAVATDTGSRSSITRFISASDSAIGFDSSGNNTNAKIPARILRDTYVTSSQFGSKTVSSVTFGDRTVYVHPESIINFV